MKTTVLFVLFWITIICFIPGKTEAQVSHLCDLPAKRAELIKQHPEILADEQALEDYTQAFVQQFLRDTATRSARGEIIIPVVFHVINQGGTENISDAQVEDEVRIMNEDYNKQNGDTSEVIGNFKYIIANMGITFRLANIDPNGNCTNGIDRVTSDQTWVGDDYSKLNSWDRSKYINVWLVNQMGGGAAGYAYYPSAVAAVYATPAMDGVIIIHNYIGSIGTSSPLTSRALTHEIGHCFNLEHCWGNDNNPGVACGDDGVGDTPVTKGWEYCPDSVQSIVCTAGIVENYQNYMEYSYCSKMFTIGQMARVMAALNSNVAQRNNLYTDSNLIATGTADTFRSPCAPIANFCVSNRFICAGDSVTFLNSSGNGDSISYSWQFPTGVPTVAYNANPVIQFNSLGFQPVILTATNAYGSSTYVDSTLLYVGSGDIQYVAPYLETFESPSVISPGNWSSINYDANNTYDNNVTWFTSTTTTAHTGSACVMLNNYYAHANSDIDELISPVIDLTGLTPSQARVSFYYSIASANQYLGGNYDSIAVYISKDMGHTWGLPIIKTGGSKYLNGGYVPGYYTPGTTPEFWQKLTGTIPTADLSLHSAIFKIRAFTSVRGNNLYIDDFNIGNSTAGIEQPGNLANVSLFPNPSDGNATLDVELETDSRVTIKVYDITGQQVINVYDGNMFAGDNRAEINGWSLAAGVYIVNIKSGDSTKQLKWVVK